jgi:hypothetical protein
MAMSGSNEAHAVAHRHPVEAAHPTHRALMHWKNNRVAAPRGTTSALDCRRPFAGIYLPVLHGRIMRSDRRLYIP